jgi:hypothetical protein
MMIDTAGAFGFDIPTIPRLRLAALSTMALAANGQHHRQALSNRPLISEA